MLGGPLAAQEKPADKSEKGKAQTAQEERQRLIVAEGNLVFEAPASWNKVKPKFDFVHADLTIPKSAGDGQDGRITISQVGGGVEQNLERWIDQFQDIDVEDDKQFEKTSITVDGRSVELIRISGTFLDSAGGPFGPKTERPDYILIGAAIEMDKAGAVYIKAYGPKKTMDANKAAIESTIKSMKVADG
jgi:hypothetical protein